MAIDITNKDVFFQVIDVDLADPGTPDQVVETFISANRDYNKVIGIGWFEQADGGAVKDYLVGFRTNRKTWIEDISAKAWDADQNVAIMQKYMEVNIPYGSGDTLYARVTPGVALTSNLVGQMVLILQKDLTELNK